MTRFRLGTVPVSIRTRQETLRPKVSSDTLLTFLHESDLLQNEGVPGPTIEDF